MVGGRIGGTNDPTRLGLLLDTNVFIIFSPERAARQGERRPTLRLNLGAAA